MNSVQAIKRQHDTEAKSDAHQTQGEPETKCLKAEAQNVALTVTKVSQPKSNLCHNKDKLVPLRTAEKLTPEEIDLLQNVTTSCTDRGKISAAIAMRVKNRLSMRLPEHLDDATYYIENGLMKVYPYPYLYQTYTKRRWIGRKLIDVMRQEFRDISYDSLKERFDDKRILVNGNPVSYDHILRDNNFITNLIHRHELPVLAAPIKKIYEDKDTLVIDKPPSIPIHPCGRFRYNSVANILKKQFNYDVVKIVHRLDRLVSGVVIIARNATRAHKLETMISGREVLKEYVCRVTGEFPSGDPNDDGFITVDQPLDHLHGKIGVTIVDSSGKQSVTKFKRLNYNGKTSCVLCKPLTGRMHQIRVHLQYLGHPIVNDHLYNSDAFGPSRGKGGQYGKSQKQLSSDVLASHRASSWLITEDNDILESTRDDTDEIESKKKTTSQPDYKIRFLNEDERRETTAALGHYFTEESWKDMEQKYKYDPTLDFKDPTCSDCVDKFHDPPLRKLFLYLHAYRYSGTGWCYQSDMPVWARDSWEY